MGEVGCSIFVYVENFNQNKFTKTDTTSSLDDNELFATRLVCPHLIKTMPICILVGKNKRRRRSENIFFSPRFFAAAGNINLCRNIII